MKQSNSYVVSQIPNQEMIPNKKNLNQTDIKHLVFFSHYCKHSTSVLNQLNTKQLMDKVNLICIDNRYIKDNVTYVVVEENNHMALPPMIQSVPTMCILPNHEVLKGNQIMHYFQPISNNISEEREKINLEPNPFDFKGQTTGGCGVSSDNFSFWDSTHDELSASGNGGTKQMYDYVSVDQQDEQIYTPQEDAKSSKSVNLEQLQQQRQNEI